MAFNEINYQKQVNKNRWMRLIIIRLVRFPNNLRNFPSSKKKKNQVCWQVSKILQIIKTDL